MFPKHAAEYQRYTIQSGDALERLARQWRTTVQEIQSLNNIPDPNNIRVGEDLLIPPPKYQDPSQGLSEDFINIFMNAAHQWENAQNVGYDPETGMWRPFRDPNNRDVVVGRQSVKVPDDQINRLFTDDEVQELNLNKLRELNRRALTQHPDWGDIPDWIRLGSMSQRWRGIEDTPKFLDAWRNRAPLEDLRKQMVTYMTRNGERVETPRPKKIWWQTVQDMPGFKEYTPE